MPSLWQPGQLLFAGFEGAQVPPDLEKLIREGRVGGVILFGRNLRDPHQVQRLVRRLHDLAPPEAPLLLAIDQEGGRVQRLRDPWTEWPPMRRLGELDDPEVTARVAEAIAGELVDLGIHLDFAPVADVDTNPGNPVIGDRSFARDGVVVARHVRRFTTAMQGAGVAACAKHFPGHGDTHSDSHLELPVLPHDMDRLRATELVPFMAAVEAGVAAIMTAHVSFPKLDARRPATLSPDVMAILREELAYDGVVFSDDLEMKAVADRYRPFALAQGCLEAGVDALLVCRNADLREEVLRSLERFPDSMVEASVERVVEMKRRYANAMPDEATQAGPPYADHVRLATLVAKGPR